MRPLIRSHIITALAAFGLLASAPAFAQETGISGELERTASTTSQEKMQYASDANNEMRDAVKRVSKLLEAARREQDVVKIQCLNNRLTSLRALLQVSEASEGALNDAIANGEDEKANHEFRKTAVALSKARQILAEAERCAGDAGAADGSTVVEVSGALTSDTDPTEGVAVDDSDIGYDPPDVSPFQ